MRRTSIYVPGSGQNYSGPKPHKEASYHSRKDGEINEGKKNSTKPSMTNQVATVLENTSPMSNLTHKESAQENSMMTEFEEILLKIDEELGLNYVSKDSVSIPVPVDAPFENLIARDSESNTISAQLGKPDGIAYPIGPLILSDLVGSSLMEKKGSAN